MKIGYSKVGRSWRLDPHDGVTGSGDVDVVNALKRLAELRPDDTFYLLGRNSGELPQDVGYPENVVNPWVELGPILKEAQARTNEQYTAFVQEHTRELFAQMDRHIVWAGQHGTSNTVIPKVDDRSEVTSPQDSMIRYAGFIIDGINRWRDHDPAVNEEIWLCPDVRNYIKCRDLKWPLKSSVVAQYDWANKTKHERYGDTTDPSEWDAVWDNEGVWHANTRYTYDALELTALDAPDESDLDWGDHPLPFGMIVNENRAYVSQSRLNAVQDYVLSWMPEAEIFGKWSPASLKAMAREDIRPCPSQYMRQTLRRWKTTLTTPASGSGWATAKPWEAFQNGVVCFFHPKYDSQGHILKSDPELAKWLRTESPEDFRKRVEYVVANDDVRQWIINQQYKLFKTKFAETLGGVNEIMRRL